MVDDIESEHLRKVGPGIMVRDNFHALERSRNGVPFLFLLRERVLKLFEIGRVIGSMGAIQFRKLLSNVPGNHSSVFGIGPIMRIPEWMNVAHRTVDGACGLLQN